MHQLNNGTMSKILHINNSMSSTYLLTNIPALRHRKHLCQDLVCTPPPTISLQMLAALNQIINYKLSDKNPSISPTPQIKNRKAQQTLHSTCNKTDRQRIHPRLSSFNISKVLYPSLFIILFPVLFYICLFIVVSLKCSCNSVYSELPCVHSVNLNLNYSTSPTSTIKSSQNLLQYTGLITGLQGELCVLCCLLLEWRSDTSQTKSPIMWP